MKLLDPITLSAAGQPITIGLGDEDEDDIELTGEIGQVLNHDVPKAVNRPLSG